MRSPTSAQRRPFIPPVESRHFKHGPPKPPGNSPRVCACGANVAAICLSGGKSRLRMATAARACRVLFSFSRPAPRGPARSGVATLRGTAQCSLRAHPPRQQVGMAECFALRSRPQQPDIFRPEARHLVGASGRKMFLSKICSHHRRVFAMLQIVAMCHRNTHGELKRAADKLT